MHSPIANPSIRRLRHDLRRAFPGIPASHVAEALAMSLGFNTAIALRSAARQALPGAHVPVDPSLLAGRLSALGHRVTVATCEKAISDALAAEGLTDEGAAVLLACLLAEAAAHRAIDIHLVVGKSEAITSFRVDGPMEDRGAITAGLGMAICEAAFVAGRRPGQNRSPDGYEGGRILPDQFSLSEGVASVRLQFNPHPGGGRYMICRLLYRSFAGGNLATMGFTRSQTGQLEGLRDVPFGITFVGGPTGSGKSTTLQRAAVTARGVAAGRKVVVIEDPEEYPIPDAIRFRMDEFFPPLEPGIPIHRRLHDDAILILGEIRERRDAALAFTAAMTGSTVFASIHADDAAGIMDRLAQFGIEYYKLHDHTLLRGLVGQRLVRRLCKHCSIPWAEAARTMSVTPAVSAAVANLGQPHDLGDIRAMSPAGCPRCRKGVHGRELVAEVVVADRRFLQLLVSGDREAALGHWLSDLDGTTMLENAVAKMLVGKLDPRHVIDVVGDFGEIPPGRWARILSIVAELRE